MSHQGDIYQIVSGMVDKRMAEHGQDTNETVRKEKTRSGSHGSNEEAYKRR